MTMTDTLVPTASHILLPALTDTAGWQQVAAQTGLWVGIFGALILALCALSALKFARSALKWPPNEFAWLLGARITDGLLFPLVWLLLLFGLRIAMTQFGYGTLALRVAFPVALALLVVNLLINGVGLAFKSTPWFASVRTLIVWLVWLCVVAWFSGIASVVIAELDNVQWLIGKDTVSLKMLLSGLFGAIGVFIIALWLSAAIETRLLANSVGAELSVRKAISNIFRVVLLFVGLMLALSTVGIDLTALSVLGGGLGVGIGFGLQKLAANYISGFVILAERSLRIGDLVRVDGFEGHITDIKARYTVVRAAAGGESVVPNEMLLVNRIENLSLADKCIWQSTHITVGYDSDVEQVRTLLTDAAAQHPRVLKEPGPSASLVAFEADGLAFTLGFWISDPENGRMNVLSEVNIAILTALRSHQIEIPFPQRVIHQR